MFTFRALRLWRTRGYSDGPGITAFAHRYARSSVESSLDNAESLPFSDSAKVGSLYLDCVRSPCTAEAVGLNAVTKCGCFLFLTHQTRGESVGSLKRKSNWTISE